MALYHYTLGFPNGFSSTVGVRKLMYTHHAKNAALTDRYGIINLPTQLDTNNAKCIEVEILNGKVSKLVYRIKYNNAVDLVLVVVPYITEFKVKTVWLNKIEDKHATLNISKYIAA